MEGGVLFARSREVLASISMRSSVRNECGTKDLPTRTRARYVQGVWKEEGHLSVAAHGHAWVGENSCSLWCLCGRCVREASNRVEGHQDRRCLVLVVHKCVAECTPSLDIPIQEQQAPRIAALTVRVTEPLSWMSL